jgi:hypothetical protein
MKFYVYKSGENSFEFVTNVEEFAHSMFNPATMSFTGVMIDAGNANDAILTYRTPTYPLGNYILIDEPEATALSRKLFEAKNRILNEIVNDQQATELVATSKLLFIKLHEVNVAISELARHIHKMCGDESLSGSVEEIYSTLRFNASKQWPELFKYVNDGDTTSTG